MAGAAAAGAVNSAVNSTILFIIIFFSQFVRYKIRPLNPKFEAKIPEFTILNPFYKF